MRAVRDSLAACRLQFETVGAALRGAGVLPAGPHADSGAGRTGRVMAEAAIRVWINQGFSLHGLVHAARAARPDVAVLASATNPHAPVAHAATEFWVEPARGAVADYTDWLVDTAVRRGVDAILIQRGRHAAALQLDRFAANGIAAHVAAPSDTLALLDDKAAFAADLAGDAMLARTIAVGSVAAFEAAVRAITDGGAVACVKPARGIYGAGYWTLVGDDPFAHLTDPDARTISTEMYAAALAAREAQGDPIALVVMEHLPGLEASVDIVARHGQVLVAAARTKLDANRQRIQTDHPVMGHAAMLVARYALHGAINIQYRQTAQGEWRILEINTRPAGGAYYCEAVGIPFAATWIDVALDRAEPWHGTVDRAVLTLVAATAVDR